MMIVEEQKATPEFADKLFSLSLEGEDTPYASVGFMSSASIDDIYYVTFVPQKTLTKKHVKDMLSHKDALDLPCYCNVVNSDKTALRFAEFFGFVAHTSTDKYTSLRKL